MLSLRRVILAAVLASATRTTHATSAPTAVIAAAARAVDATPGVTPDPQPPDRADDAAWLLRREAAAATTATVAAALPSTAPEYVSDQLFTSAILNSTNFFRREHNATAAVWNTTIAAFAAAYLDNDTDCTFAHSGGPYGENIAVGFLSVHGAVDAWGDERSKYDYSDPGFSEATGHFTQLVWKNSTTVGCGRKLCSGRDGSKSTGWFLVCEYWPRGNVIGQFAEEVGRQINGTGSDDSGGEPSLAAGRPSSGVITGAVVVLGMIVAAFCNDIRMTLAET